MLLQDPTESHYPASYSEERVSQNGFNVCAKCLLAKLLQFVDGVRLDRWVNHLLPSKCNLLTNTRQRIYLRIEGVECRKVGDYVYEYLIRVRQIYCTQTWMVFRSETWSACCEYQQQFPTAKTAAVIDIVPKYVEKKTWHIQSGG